MGYREFLADRLQLENKRVVRALSLFLAAALFAYGSFSFADRLSSVRKTASAKKEEVKRFQALQTEYLKKKAEVDAVSGRAYSDGSESVVALMNGLGRSLGIQEAVTSIKPLEEKDLAGGYRERDVEMAVEGIELNELLNLLYRIENNRALLAIREFSVKSRFDDPERLDARLRIAHIIKSAP